MPCPGLHCPGCSGGQSLGVLAAVVGAVWVADQLVQWVADRIWWIGSTAFVAVVLAVAASMWLQAWTDRREARFAARRGIVSRADVILPEPVRGVVVERVPERPAIAPAPQVVINIFGMPSAEQAAVIRQALPGAALEAIAESETPTRRARPYRPPFSGGLYGRHGRPSSGSTPD